MAGATTKQARPIDVWLRINRARRLWSLDIPNVDGGIDCYMVNGHLLVVREFEGGGWDVFIPASETNQTGPTLAAVAEFCGLPHPSSQEIWGAQ